MSKLVVVESPAKAHTINRILGKSYVVEASMGHVRDLPRRRIGVDLQNDFAPEYEILPDRKKLIARLRKAAAGAEEVFLATDLDREGESIAWHLAEALRVPAEKVRRVVFNQITAKAIRAAFAHPSSIDADKVNAQQARRVLDRIVGYQLSPLLWRSVAKGLSAGRVQSVAVRLVVDREREIQAFNPEEYWKIIATLAPHEHDERGPEPKQFDAELKKVDGKKCELHNEEETSALVAGLEQAAYAVDKVTTTQKKQAAPPPFITSTLQQQGSSQLRFSAKRTMALAQQLYEGIDVGDEGAVGLITYMRTDSVQVAQEALDECRDFIGEKYGAEVVPDKPNRFRSGKRAQAAHEAIRPTSVLRTPEQMKPHLNRDQFRLYQLVWKRFVASQMKPAVYAVTDVSIVASFTRQTALAQAPARGTFQARGRVLVFAGHTIVSGRDAPPRSRDERPGAKDALGVQSDGPLLPRLEDGQDLRLLGLAQTQHFTKPPPRYTEASLVRTMERLGIGRPSTYAPILSTIQQRRYVRQEKRQFHATELGMHVTDLLVKHFADVMDSEFTSRMEEQLDSVEEAKAEWVKVLRDFYERFRKDMEEAKNQMAKSSSRSQPTEETCPQCSKQLVIRWSARGRFLGCSGYPECRYTRPLDEDGDHEAEPPPPDPNVKCELCGAPMVVRTGRRGRFLGCSTYPKCTYTRSLDEKPSDGGQPVGTVTDTKCDVCGKPMVMRRSRRGPFLGCSGFPKCRNTKPL